MVRDGIFYALGFAGRRNLDRLPRQSLVGTPLFLLAAFCAWFFRDPERAVPPGR